MPVLPPNARYRIILLKRSERASAMRPLPRRRYRPHEREVMSPESVPNSIYSPRPHNAGIAGLGMCVPDRILTNDDLAQIVETSDEWITTRTGIKERRIADAD